MLTGAETKALREGKGNLVDAYVLGARRPAQVLNLEISRYSHDHQDVATPPRRTRGLLLKAAGDPAAAGACAREGPHPGAASPSTSAARGPSSRWPWRAASARATSARRSAAARTSATWTACAATAAEAVARRVVASARGRPGTAGSRGGVRGAGRQCTSGTRGGVRGAGRGACQMD